MYLDTIDFISFWSFILSLFALPFYLPFWSFLNSCLKISNSDCRVVFSWRGVLVDNDLGLALLYHIRNRFPIFSSMIYICTFKTLKSRTIIGASKCTKQDSVGNGSFLSDSCFIRWSFWWRCRAKCLLSNSWHGTHGSQILCGHELGQMRTILGWHQLYTVPIPNRKLLNICCCCSLRSVRNSTFYESETQPREWSYSFSPLCWM